MSVSPTQLLHERRTTLLRKYGDLAANPDVSLPRHGARGDQGPVDAALPERRVQRQGRPERELRPRVRGALHARRERTPSRARRTTARTTSRSSRSRSPAGTSTTRTRTTPRRCSTPAAGSTGRSRSSASSATTTPTASSTSCSARTATRRTSSRSCGASSCPRRPRRRRCSSSSTDYTAGGRKIKPLLRSDPHRPAALRVDRRAEHDQAAGRLRERRAARPRPRRHARPGPADYLDSMGQLPYFPPTVAGWEGGLSWLNTNTALARFGFVGDVIGNAPNGSPAKVARRPQRDAAGGLRPRLRRGRERPGCRPARVRRSRTTPTRASVKSSKDRIARQVMLRTLMLAGPDAQVM